MDDAYQLLYEMRSAVVTQYIYKGSEKGRLTQYSLPETLSVCMFLIEFIRMQVMNW